MKIDGKNGIVTGVKYIPSPNFNERPTDCHPEVVIVHSISLPPGQYGGGQIEDFFCNRLDCASHPYFEGLRDLKVSSHFLIRRSGEIIQFVPVGQRAWHAGESICEGRENVNDFSVGIELEGCDEDEFEDSQYESLNALIEVLIDSYPKMSRRRIYGHSEIAPERKTDPGPNFVWSRVRDT